MADDKVFLVETELWYESTIRTRIFRQKESAMDDARQEAIRLCKDGSYTGHEASANPFVYVLYVYDSEANAKEDSPDYSITIIERVVQ